MSGKSIIACIMKDYIIQNDKGENIRIKNEKRVGYFCSSGNDEKYFYGIIFDWNEKKQSYSDGGTAYLSKKEFNENVRQYINIFPFDGKDIEAELELVVHALLHYIVQKFDSELKQKDRITNEINECLCKLYTVNLMEKL